MSIMTTQRELKTDRMASIKNCKAKGGPLNCRYHSGVISDCMKDVRGTTNALINEKKEIDAATQQKNKEVLENNVQQLLDIYKTNSDETFELQDGTVLSQEEIINIRNSLEHIIEALHNGQSHGKQLLACVNDFNHLVKLPSDRRHFYMPITDLLEDNCIGERLPGLISYFADDGSFDKNTHMSFMSINEDNDVSEDAYERSSNNLYQLFQQKSQELGARINAYESFSQELRKLYPPSEKTYFPRATDTYNRTNPYACENRMNKSDVKMFWDYITDKHPVLKEEYQTIMNQTEPSTPQELDKFIRKSPNFSNLTIYKNSIDKMITALDQNELSPLGEYLTFLADRQLQGKEPFSEAEEDKHLDKMAKELFIDVYNGKGYKTVKQLIQETDAINANYDMFTLMHKIDKNGNISSAFTDFDEANSLSRQYDVDYDTVKRVITKDGELRYDITYHSDRYADMSDDSRYWGTDKKSVLSILLTKDKPIITTHQIQQEHKNPYR